MNLHLGKQNLFSAFKSSFFLFYSAIEHLHPPVNRITAHSILFSSHLFESVSTSLKKKKSTTFKRKKKSSLLLLL